MKSLIILLILSLPVAAQQQPSGEEEQKLLQEAVSRAGNSPVEFIRVAERHLKKFPQSALREKLEKAILTAAVDAKDHGRIISYGEKGLQWGEDPALLDRVARALLQSDDPESARRAVKYAERLEKAAAAKSEPQVAARALALQARAWGNTGEIDKAIALARKSYDTYPNGEAAREAGRWEVRAGRIEQAIEHYAVAFSIPDPTVTDENRAHHRALLGELYRKLHGSEAGLGDLILKAYDRASQAVKAREDLVKTANPNSGVLDGLQFRLSGLRGDSIRLADFHGKVIVLDFWATWCAPCRFQHPLLEQLRTKYKNDPGVAFVSINTDQDRAAVKPFIEQLHWSDQVYFDDGLARFYRVISIPTTMIFSRAGDLVTRLPGFDESYVELLTGKIEEARRD